MIVLRNRYQWFVAAGLAFIMFGFALSRFIEPDVRVESVTLAGDTPALKFLPARPGPHPIALLAHGVTASKESLFRYGEGLAAAGFVCFALDFPGHGASRMPFSSDEIVSTVEKVSGALGSVDIFLGHSMGCYAAAVAVRNKRLSPRLFIAVGANPNLGELGPPLLLLAGKFEECFSQASLRARTDARVIISPWSDHALEPFDPLLINAAVRVACEAMGMTPPPPPTRWLWRLAGVVLGVSGAFCVALSLPEVSGRLAPLRGLLLAASVVAAFALTTSTWLGAAPHVRRLPQLIVMLAVASLLVVGAGKLRIPRWTFLAVAMSAWFAFLLAGAHTLAFFVSCFVMVLLASTFLAAIAAWRGSQRDGDVAVGIFVGYALGQWLPMLV